VQLDRRRVGGGGLIAGDAVADAVDALASASGWVEKISDGARHAALTHNVAQGSR
jgi:hypothetical protein